MTLNESESAADLAPRSTKDITSLQMKALSLIMELSDKQLEQAIQTFLEGEKNERIKKVAG